MCAHVGSLTEIWLAIAWLLRPWAIRRSTSISRAVSASGAGCGSAGPETSCSSLRAMEGSVRREQEALGSA